jgi:hypothetical protein
MICDYKARFHRPTRAIVPLDYGPEEFVTRNNLLFLIIGALVIVAAVMGYQLYQDRHEPKGLNINVGPGGLSIKDK